MEHVAMIKDAGFNKNLSPHPTSLLYHFIIKLLENSQIDPLLLEKLYFQLSGEKSKDAFENKVSQLPHLPPAVCETLLTQWLAECELPQKLPKKEKMGVLDPDSIHFRQFSKEAYFQEEPELFSNGFFMKKFQRMKTVLGHQKQENFHDNLDPDDQTIPLYNIVYDHSGQLLFTADDNGVIKVWSTFSMQLLYQLRGHTDLVHAIELTEDNKHLITCSQDSTIRIWDIATQKMVNLLKQDYQNSILTVTLYKEHLISVSENGEICIYKEFMKSQNPRSIRLDHDVIKEASCVAVSNFGEIVMGTSEGTMYVYESMEQLKYKSKLSYAEWHQHNKSVHNVLFSKNSDHFMTGSLDGTMSLWDWQPNFNVFHQPNPLIVIGFDEGKTQNRDSKCWAVNFSWEGNYAIGAFGKKNRKNAGAEDQIQTQIVIYSYHKHKIIHRLSEETCGIAMNKEIYVIETSPVKEEIMFSGDFEGQIILWDIEQGIILNIFKEMAMPLQQPNLETPIVDGRFSPDGQTFVVSTFYGNFSLYGYGPKQVYNYSYYDQFGEKDYIEVHTGEDLGIYNANGVPFEEIKDIQLDQKKNFKDVQVQLDYPELRAQNFFTPAIVDELPDIAQDRQSSFQIIKNQNKKKHRYWKLHFIQQKAQALTILRQQNQAKQNQIKPITPQQPQQRQSLFNLVPSVPSQPTRTIQTRYEESEADFSSEQLSSESSEDQPQRLTRVTRLRSLNSRQQRDNSEEPIPQKRKKFALDSISESEEPQQKQQIQEKLYCERCKHQIDNYLACHWCSLKFCPPCGELRGDWSKNHYMCYDHLDGQDVYEDYSEIQKEWLDDESVYRAQIGDRVVYHFQGYETFIKEYHLYDAHIYDTDKYPLPCEVIDISYEFPNYYIEGYLPPIMMKLQLRSEFGEFSVLWCNEDKSLNYLVPQEIFDKRQELWNRMKENSLWLLDGEQWTFDGFEEAEEKFETGWKNVKIYQAKTRSQKVEKKMNVWDIIPVDLNLKGLSFERISRLLNDLVECVDSEYFSAFVEQVDKSLYKDYYSQTYYEMYVQKLIQQIDKKHYRSKGSKLYEFADRMEQILVYLVENEEEENILEKIRKEFKLKFMNQTPSSQQIEIRRSSRRR